MGQTVLVSETLPKFCRKGLEELGLRPLLLPPFSALSGATASHTDLLCFLLDKTAFCYGDYLTECPSLEEALQQAGYTPRPLGDPIGPAYPRDIGLNGLRLGKRLFAKLSHFSPSVRSAAEARGLRLIDVRQGYARCTACPVSEDALITADPSIARAAEREGLSVLSISPGHVILEGYPYGFLGGACGVWGDRLLFTGELAGHPDGEAIAAFCRAHGKEPISLSREPLTDVGSLFVLE